MNPLPAVALSTGNAGLPWAVALVCMLAVVLVGMASVVLLLMRTDAAPGAQETGGQGRSGAATGQLAGRAGQE